MAKINNLKVRITGAISNGRNMALDSDEGKVTMVEGAANMAGEEDVISGHLNGQLPTGNMEHFVRAQNREDEGLTYGSWMLVTKPKRANK